MELTPLPAFNDNYIWLIRSASLEGIVAVDPGDAATVIEALRAIMNLDLIIIVTAYAALAENMPSASAQRPSDVVTTYGGKIYLRRIEFTDTEEYHNIFNDEKLKEIHKVVYDKPYDIVVTDWIEAYCKKDRHPQKTSRFFCSSFIGYVYTKLGLFNESLDWSILYPSYFSSENKTFSMLHDASLSKEHQISG